MTMTKPSPKHLFEQSLGRCLSNGDFIQSFYDRFLSSSEEVARKFRHTDFDQQKAMLRRSLSIVAGATEGQKEALTELADRARTHSRRHLNIRPELYDQWLEAVVESAREFDSGWDAEIEHAWRQVLGFAVNYMKARYDR
jgi:hemoglobin-like flavoprotein